MAYEIHFLGLNRITTSIAMALGNTEGEVRRTGFDPLRSLGKTALETGAIDRQVSNPRKDLKNADLVVLGLPMNETRDFMDVFADQLPEEVIILDTSTIKTASFLWAKELLPESCHYIGIAPIVGPQAISDEALDDTGPRADLFEDGLMGIIATPSTKEDAMAIAINLAKVLGATPFFIDSHEHDAATAMLEGFPLLLEAALVQVGAGSPGWRELQRMAGVTFAASTQQFASADPQQVGSWLYLNRDKVMDRINALETELATIRSSLQSEDESIRYAQGAASARQVWMDARRRADWEEVESTPLKEVDSVNWFNSLFGFRIRKPKESGQDS